MAAPRILRAVDHFIDRLLCVFGAVLFSQAPEFFQQYLQRLGGHLAEARRQVAAFEGAAAAGGTSLQGLAQQASASSEPALAQLGSVVAQSAARVDALQHAHDAIQGASVWLRPLVFLRNLDAEIARATWSAFKPAVPTTAEGLVYALAGMLVVLAVYYTLRNCAALLLPQLRGERRQPA